MILPGQKKYLLKNNFNNNLNMIKHFEIPSENGSFIHANFFEAKKPKQLLIICSATGVKQEFYHEISKFIHQEGTTAITFDYSGIGYSLKTNIKKVKSSLSDWGTNDLTAVINYSVKIYPNLPIAILGHSIGGQLIGLTKASLLAHKIILVCAQNGFWGNWSGISRVKMWTNWNILVPILIKIFGYLPSKKFSRMEDLPKYVADEWKDWCNNRNYLFAFIDNERLFFRKIKCEIISYSVAFDKYAPQKSIDKLIERYSNANIKRVQIYPENLNFDKIGHFGLFQQKSKYTFWDKLRQEVQR
ncbi:alpha/beta hydrolase family protein [Aequorivita antarctica]|uniref:Serine aminopeptidase S33 domain-containing protein n=1 Tax=Aequorivita antarctica TaxID=153266 RepID=A0A5C6YZS0_9FLAO|nr:alpha/beta hydrolase [Aequorivita antarctica]TXD73263.1 hypothetical protein ESU54_08990 [Aequorivita antarctica]SRX76016.1 hypothetical protein AEQU3_03014 [Aequorivita antarctica]